MLARHGHALLDELRAVIGDHAKRLIGGTVERR